MKIIVGIILVVVVGYAHAGDGGIKSKSSTEKLTQVQIQQKWSLGQLLDQNNKSIFDTAATALAVGDIVAAPEKPKAASIVVGIITRTWITLGKPHYVVRVGGDYCYMYPREDLRKLVETCA